MSSSRAHSAYYFIFKNNTCFERLAAEDGSLSLNALYRLRAELQGVIITVKYQCPIVYY